jgi:hypothetical protein
MPAYEVVHRLEASAVDRGPAGVDDQYGHGNLNLDAALTGNIAPGPSPSPWIRRSAGPSTAAAQPTTTPGDPAADPPDGGGRGVLVATLAVAGGVLVLLAGAAWLVIRRRRAGH